MMKFQEWIDFVFNHPVGGDQEWYEGGYEKPSLTIAETAALMTQTFTECGTALRPYSDGQVAIGLQFLTQPKKSDYIRAATSRELDIETRATFLASIEHLYLDCFVPRCASVTPEEGMGNSYLNTVCDQFWVNNDLPVLLASMGKKKRDSGDVGQRSTALQQVFKTALNTRNVACTHSALLGLGLAHPHIPTLVEQIITEFLSVKGARLPKNLFAFAKAARKGKV